MVLYPHFQVISDISTLNPMLRKLLVLYVCMKLQIKRAFSNLIFYVLLVHKYTALFLPSSFFVFNVLTLFPY